MLSVAVDQVRRGRFDEQVTSGLDGGFVLFGPPDGVRRFPATSNFHLPPNLRLHKGGGQRWLAGSASQSHCPTRRAET